MNVLTLQLPHRGEPLLPRTPYRTLSQFGWFLVGSGLVKEGQELNVRTAGGFYADQKAGVVLTATSCDWPLFFAECETLAQFLQMDLVLLWFDPLLGASFDVLLAGSQNWLCDFLAWRRDGEDTWLVPAQASGPFFCLTGKGLDACESAPYSNGSDRHACIIRAIERPSFDGGF